MGVSLIDLIQLVYVITRVFAPPCIRICLLSFCCFTWLYRVITDGPDLIELVWVGALLVKLDILRGGVAEVDKIVLVVLYRGLCSHPIELVVEEAREAGDEGDDGEEEYDEDEARLVEVDAGGVGEVVLLVVLLEEDLGLQLLDLPLLSFDFLLLGELVGDLLVVKTLLLHSLLLFLLLNSEGGLVNPLGTGGLEDRFYDPVVISGVGVDPVRELDQPARPLRFSVVDDDGPVGGSFEGATPLAWDVHVVLDDAVGACLGLVEKVGLSENVDLDAINVVHPHLELAVQLVIGLDHCLAVVASVPGPAEVNGVRLVGLAHLGGRVPEVIVVKGAIVHWARQHFVASVSEAIGAEGVPLHKVGELLKLIRAVVAAPSHLELAVRAADVTCLETSYALIEVNIIFSTGDHREQ
mmetsp:Transcript_17925/g.30489  ORF Transcript_17925/g.30489 Transcript_17925/m.30489 type:complete len:410 (+) Transcript_17925:423-1652(+)